MGERERAKWGMEAHKGGTIGTPRAAEQWAKDKADKGLGRPCNYPVLDGRRRGGLSNN